MRRFGGHTIRIPLGRGTEKLKRKEQIIVLLKDHTYDEVARRLGVHRSTIFRNAKS